MKSWFKPIFKITQTQTIKDTVIVSSGMFISTLLGATSIFLIARLLGPAQYGLYASALGIVTILIDSVDLGIGGSILNFAAKKDQHSGKFVKYGFLLKIILGFSLGLIFAFISQPLANYLHPEIKEPLLIASLFIPLVFLLRFPRSILQAEKKFFKDILIENFTHFFRLALILFFFYYLSLTTNLALIAYLLGALIAFLVATRFISWQFLKAKISSITKSKFFTFQKWLSLGFILAAFHSRIDSAILLKLTNSTTTGIYQAAYRFFIPAIQLAAALSLIYAPRFASFKNSKEAKKYLLKAAKLSFLFGLFVLLIIPLAPFFIKIIFGSQYSLAVLPTRILSFGFVFFVAGSPFVSYLIYSINKTKAFFFLS